MKTKLLITMLVAAVMLAAMALALPMGAATAAPQAGPAAAPAAAPQAIQNYFARLIYQGNGITATATGNAVGTLGYSLADCYSIVDVTNAQTVTVVISHSADASNWVTWNSFTAVSADGTAFTTSVPYGAYLRATAGLGGSNPVTVTVRCVLKD